MRQKKKKKTTTNMDFHSAMEVFAEAWAVAKTRAALEACRGEKVSLWPVFRDRQTVGMLTGHTEGDPRQDGPPRPGTTRGDTCTRALDLKFTNNPQTDHWPVGGKGERSGGGGLTGSGHRGVGGKITKILIPTTKLCMHVGDLMLVMVVVSWI